MFVKYLKFVGWFTYQIFSGLFPGRKTEPVSGRMPRHEVINGVISSISASAYLEIGVNTPNQPGYSRDKIVVPLMHGVDPNPLSQADFVMTSDEFFGSPPPVFYDVIFIDGLHLFEQCFRDILNATKLLTENGLIIVHDTRPVSWRTQTRQQGKANKWHGDVWKSILLLRIMRPELKVSTVDTDEGCTIISKRGGSELLIDDSREIFSWKFFVGNYKEILNLTSVDEFRREFQPRPD